VMTGITVGQSLLRPEEAGSPLSSSLHETYVFRKRQALALLSRAAAMISAVVLPAF